MSDWRTSQAPYQQRSRLPEDDLPEIDWGESAFTPGGGDEPEPEPMPDPGEEERAMARLRARIAERDAAEGLMDPWAQEQAAPMGPQPSPPLPGSPAPLRAPRGGRTMTGSGLSMGMPEMLPAAPPAAPMTPQQMAQAAFRQPALDAVRAGVGAVTPPVDPMAPPPTPTAPDAVPQATTNPDAPTVTAGSQAAGLAQRPAAPQSPTTDPTGAPQFAMGATGLQGPQAGMSDRVAAGVPAGNMFDRQLDTARAEDVRRERIRKIILGIGAMVAGGTGNMGLMLPAAIGAGLVRNPDEEATLRANDERAQAVGGAQAEQRALLEQLAMRREAQQAQERQGQQTLALRAAELQGTQADRATRTGLEVARTDPTSGRSEQMREALVRFARTLPPEVQQSVLSGDLSGLSAEESERLILSLSNIEGERQRGGGAGGSGGLATGQRLAGVNTAPEAFVLSVREGSPSMTPEEARQSADMRWSQMRERDRADWESTPDGVRARTALAQRIPGYEQETTGTLSPEQHSQARAAVANQAAFDVAMERALSAADQIEALPAAEQAALRAGDMVGYENNDALASYNDARGAIIAQLNRLAEAGVMNESEFARWEQQLPRISDFRSLGDATRRLRAVQQRVREMTDARLAATGYRRSAGTAPTTTADAPPAPEREHTITIRATRNGETRSRTVPISEADRWRAQGVAAGWTVVQ